MSPCRSRSVEAFYVDVQVTGSVHQAVSTVVIVVEIIPHLQCIGGNPGVYFIVSQNRDIESILYIRTDIEIRGVVFTKKDRICQYLVAGQRPNQQIGGIVGGIVFVFLPLIGNRWDRTLHIG